MRWRAWVDGSSVMGGVPRREAAVRLLSSTNERWENGSVAGYSLRIWNSLAGGSRRRLMFSTTCLNGWNRAYSGIAVRAVHLCAKTVQCGQFARRGDPKDRAALVVGPRVRGSAVEFSIGGLHQRGREPAVGAVRLAAKVIESCQCPSRRNAEDRAREGAAGPAMGRGPVEVAVWGLDQRRRGLEAIGAIR